MKKGVTKPALLLRGQNLEYLCEIETEFENMLNCLSGGQMDLNHEKKSRSKIS